MVIKNETTVNCEWKLHLNSDINGFDIKKGKAWSKQ